MRPISLKYADECRECHILLAVGASAIYERRVGVFCPSCAPTDPETIRTYRQEAADRKAGRLEEWASKRLEKAAELEARNEPYRGDIAFATQPGHIPERARAIARQERAWEHAKTARAFEARADRLRRGVRVAGDAAKAQQARREANDAKLSVGSRVTDFAFGEGIILAIFKKSYRIKWDRSGSVFARDKFYVRPATLAGESRREPKAESPGATP